jgi:hypothetical protein
MFFLRDPLTEEVQGPISPKDVRDIYSQGGYENWELSKSNAGPWTPLCQVKGLAPQPTPALAGVGAAPGYPHPSQSPNAVVQDDVVYCRVCGKRGAAQAVACLGCGVPPGVGDKYCNRCGVGVPHPQAVMCVNCGSSLASGPSRQGSAKPNAHSHQGNSASQQEIDVAVQSVRGSQKYGDYYKKVFTEINDEGGGFKASWNWHAFLLGPFYFLSHGLYIKALLLFGVGLLFFPASWAYAGLAFNYDLYLKKVKGKDLW